MHFSELHTPVPLEASTPIQLNRVDEMVEYSSSSEAEDQSDTPKSESEDFICENSTMSVTQFSDDFFSVIDQHALSDRAAKSVLNLIERCLPKKNQLPSFYRLQQIENSLRNVKQETLPDGVIYHLDVENQLLALLERNADLMLSPNWQLNDDVVLTSKNDCEVLHFVMSTDGVSPAKSKKFCLYPVWLMLLNLPQKRRACYKNLILISLYGGVKKPDCSSLVKNLVQFVHNFNQRKLIVVNEKTYKVMVNIRLVAVDAVMKAPLLNQIQFNGAYGCNDCYIRGCSHPSGKPWLYAFGKTPSELRTNKKRIEDLSAHPKAQNPKFGLKGPSCLEEVVSIPEDVVIDYMHQVLLGVVRKYVYNIVKQKSFSHIHSQLASKRLLHCRLPIQDYNRQLRGIDSVKLWKASELKLFLLYGFMSLFGLLSDAMFAHFFLLSSAIRILLEPQTVKEIDIAGNILTCFRKQLVRFYGDKSETFNAHTLSHLSDQVKQCGPLSSSSSIVFEAAHFQLKRRISESTSISVFTRLAVKRHQRIVGRREDFKTKLMKIGSVVLKNSREVEVDLEGERAVFRTSNSFSFQDKNYHIHTSVCRFLETGSCDHFVKYEESAELFSFGQLLAIFVDIENFSGVAHLKVYRIHNPLRLLLSERLQELESSNLQTLDSDLDLSEKLEILGSADDKHFLIDLTSAEVVEIDITRLLSPCIIRSVGNYEILSEICCDFERD